MSSRRSFLKEAGLLSLGTLVLTQPSLAAGEVQMAETDPTAAALGYRHDTSKVDQAKFPKHKVSQVCLGCSLVKGKDGEAWRPCAIFPSKLVAAKGWCSAFAVKA